MIAQIAEAEANRRKGNVWAVCAHDCGTLTHADVLERIHVVWVNGDPNPERPDLPHYGAGEATCTPTRAAVANPIFDATGVWLRRVPFRDERLLAALRAAGSKDRAAASPAAFWGGTRQSSISKKLLDTVGAGTVENRQIVCAATPTPFRARSEKSSRGADVRINHCRNLGLIAANAATRSTVPSRLTCERSPR